VATDFHPVDITVRVDEGHAKVIAPLASYFELTTAQAEASSFGYAPRVFRAATLRADVLEAIRMGFDALWNEGALSALQKHCILLTVAFAGRNTYWLAAECHVLESLGLSPETVHRIAVDCRSAPLPDADRVLLDLAFTVVTASYGAITNDHMRLLFSHGFTQEAYIEAAVTAAFGRFLCKLQGGLGAEPDFPLPDFVKTVHLSGPASRQTLQDLPADPDAELVARVQGGDVDAFEQLMNRHTRCVYRTLTGILGNTEEARDAMQDTFLKAFQHLRGFQARSRFSTWLVSIAGNTAIQRLRDRKDTASLDDGGFETDEGFVPRQVQAWSDNPEQLYSKHETRMLVEESVMRLPATYRVVLMLRDMEQLSTEDTAAALGLGIPAVKSRLLRGRLMLRESLSRHFAGASKGGAV
jgi:RNA polymerase sigma-70 factor (ECF subfamily)